MYRDPVKVEVALRDAARTLNDGRGDVVAAQTLLGVFLQTMDKESTDFAIVDEVLRRLDDVWATMREAEREVTRAYAES